MIQRFIELGSGFTDLYEWFEILQRNQDRITYIFEFTCTHRGQKICSYAATLQPTEIGAFQPIYICREGITLKNGASKRQNLVYEQVEKLEKRLITIDVKHSSFFETTDFYYQYLIALLRLNHLLKPLS